MKIAVMGAGAVGCYFGGMLARAGHEVVLIARPQHVEAIAQNGLLLETTTFTEHVRVQASSDVAALAGADCVLFCVKSTDTLKAAQQMAPHLSAGATVLSLQNGVDNAQRAQTFLSATVVPAVVYVATEMAGPGHVKHHGRGELVIGPSNNSEALATEFSRSGVPVQVSDNVVGALWNKLIINCAYNALSAITQLPYGRLVQGDGITPLMHTLVEEALTVARALGVQTHPEIWAQTQAIATAMRTQFSSTAQDLAGGRPSEIDYLNGHVVREAARLGLATPANQGVLTLVKTLEAKRDDRL
jgi:2-dehydropantoate 2-reductase